MGEDMMSSRRILSGSQIDKCVELSDNFVKIRETCEFLTVA